jgi:aminopeptidase N
MRFKAILAVIFTIGVAIAVADQPLQRPYNENEILFRKGELRTPYLLGTDIIDNYGYDVLHYTIDIQIFPASEQLSGSVEMVALSERTSLLSIQVNLLSNMVVDQVLRGGSPLSFTHETDMIDIDLGVPVAEGDSFTVVIQYHGIPSAGSLQGFTIERNTYGDTLISTLSEPEDARSWWPCKDIPSEKSTETMIVTIPSHYLFASNGLLQSVEDLGNGWKRWTWHESYPITSYLISLAICDYDTFSYTYTGLQGEVMPLNFFVFPQILSHAQTDFSIIDDMITFFAQNWGEYPFIDEKYGHAIFDWSGGMEHQTITSLGGNIITGNHQYDWIYAHELSHMWWGDMVTCATWADLWLNEGFASYADAMWREHTGGSTGLNSRMASFRSSYFYEDNQSRFPIYAPPAQYLWGNTVYDKGAWIVHMFRHILGDSLFTEFFHEYRNRFAYDAATSDDFTDVLSDVAGEDMTWFSDEWVYDAGYPEYEYAWSSTALTGSQYQVDLVIDQVQGTANNTPIFRMPIDIDFYYSSSWHRFTVINDQEHQHYRWVMDQQPTNMRFDSDLWILCTRTATSMPPEIDLAYANQTVDDQTGNNNQGADPGEMVDLYVDLTNNGWDDAAGVFAELSSTDPYITIQADTSSYPLIAGFETGRNAAPYVVEVSQSCPVNYEAGMTLHVTATGGYSTDIPFDLHVGNPQLLPQGPDNYGYYALDMHDPGGPDFAWYEISPNAGGSGTELVFTEDDQTFQILLPFTFVYYGQSHDTLSVCSNGWLSPSATTNAAYGNTGIPNAAGPAGMIAPFWEDLSPQQFGVVSYYYQASQHRFVVEFYRVRQFSPNWAYETFEVMLYDPAYWTTETGDGEIVFQYHFVDDPTSCTVGIENWAQNDGLQYLYDGSYNENAWAITNGFAVKFTTGSTYAVPSSGQGITPESYVLHQNYPNPFNMQTIIQYELPEPGMVTLEVYNVLGQRIATLAHGRQEAGSHSVPWNGKSENGLDAASGVYFYRLQAGSFTQTQKMVLLK